MDDGGGIVRRGGGGRNRLPEADRAWLPQKKDGSGVNVFPIFLAADNAKNFELSGLQHAMEATLKADQALVTTAWCCTV
ncbi:hypothetical protein HQ447_10985 [bacterium]|nr:hypothetical protein [bacterium]